MMDRHDDVNSKNEQGKISMPTGKAKGWRFKTLLICGLLLVIFVIVFHYKRKARKDADSSLPSIGPVPVVSAPVKREDVGVYLNAIGTVTPFYADSITSQVTGVIKAVNYREGQFVRKGDPLVDIDPAPYLAQLSQAKGALERDENLLSQAQMDLERYKQAWSYNSISRQQYEDQEKVVLQYQGTVNYDKGAVQYAQVQANYCHIVAPISGRVGIRLVDPGNLVTANATTSLVVITQMQPITVIFTLAEDNLSELLDQTKQKLTLPVEVYDRAHDTRLGVGQLTVIDNQIDTTTGTVKLRATFANDDNKLFPNQFVNTRLLVKTLHEQTVVPSSAIQRNGDASFVFVLTDGKAQMRTVKTGPSDHGVTVVQGLQAGDVVATSSFDKLQNGTPIALSHSAAPSAADRQ